MKIRPWKYEDILRISEIEKECFPKDAWTYKMLASAFGTETFSGLVAEDGGEIIGYGGYTAAVDTADIDNIAVVEDYRRSGVAKTIIAELCKKAKKQGIKKLFLEVRVSNYAAMSLYLKCGFKGAYARLRYYPDGEDCLMMVKEL